LSHRLDPLLRPRSVAVLGASATPDSLGDWCLRNILKGGYKGDIYPVNPRYETLQGLRCYGALSELPEVPDLVLFAVADHRLEAALDDAIELGVPAAVIQSTLYVDDDSEPFLRERVKAKIDASGMLVCGANGMGFYNVRDHVWACGFDSAMHEAPGNAAFISHSGSGMCGIIDCEERLQINVAVSTGNELSVTMDEYLDFVLDLPETKVVGLFIETARNPDGMQAAFAKAAGNGVPIVALKVGRTDEAARLAVSHSGAMAGDDATYDALFDRFGVQRVRDMDELATTMIMFAEMHPVGEGGLVTLHDSGGERQLIVDLADEAGVPLAKISESTAAALAEVIDPELPAVNPLDGWSRGGPDSSTRMTRALTLLMQDEAAALGAVVHDRGPEGLVYESYLGYMKDARKASGKPVALVSARQGTGEDGMAVTWTRKGYPVLDGVSSFLRGVRALFEYRDYLGREPETCEETDQTVVDHWSARLRTGEVLPESESLSMLEDFGVPVVRSKLATSREDAIAAATDVGYPVALKTAMPGMHHKSDQSGVLLDIQDESRLAEAYDDLASRLGPDVIVCEMAGPGIEMFLGVRRDPQFGPVILLGFGGVHAEMLRDVAYALPPFGAGHAGRCLDRLSLRPLLDGRRGAPPADIDAFTRAASRFSAAVHALGGEIEEFDVNPVIVGATGCLAVDALIVPRSASSH
jgi:acyl-CoA synthetase (NDP forming)